jgi:hypothetical protein
LARGGQGQVAAGGTANIKTGTYTGDDSLSQAITGVGFKPESLWISVKYAAETEYTEGIFFATDQHAAGCCEFHDRTEDTTYDNRIISLDADGFTVDDDGANAHPNRGGVTYLYVAIAS